MAELSLKDDLAKLTTEEIHDALGRVCTRFIVPFLDELQRRRGRTRIIIRFDIGEILFVDFEQGEEVPDPSGEVH